MKRIILSLTALCFAACTAQHPSSGPLAPGVPANAPPDTIGIMLSWTPDQTLVNFCARTWVWAPAFLIPAPPSPPYNPIRAIGAENRTLSTPIRSLAGYIMSTFSLPQLLD
jgi:hypothetical protein